MRSLRSRTSALALAAALGVCALLLGVNLANDVEDDVRGIDSRGSLGGSGVLQAGLLTRTQMRAAAYALMALGIALGVPSAIASPRAMAFCPRSSLRVGHQQNP